MTKKSKMVLGAAVAGLIGATLAAAPAAAEKEKMEVEPCYGVNKCKGHGKCGGHGASCAGSNACKGQGWVPMPAESCKAIGGTLEPAKAKEGKKAADKHEHKDKKAK